MRRAIEHVRPARDCEGAQTRFAGSAGEWLPLPLRRNGPEAWLVDVHAGPITRTVRCQVGEPLRRGDSLWRRLSWEPFTERGDVFDPHLVLPDMDADLGLECGESGALRLVGSYVVPIGLLGGVIDALAMRKVADATVRSFLEAVAERLAESPGTSTSAPSPMERTASERLPTA